MRAGRREPLPAALASPPRGKSESGPVELSSITTSLPFVHGSQELGITIDYHKILHLFIYK